jgi:hypothetical protein
VATLSALSDRLRSEIGDIGKPFSQSFIANGTTDTFQLSVKPVRGSDMVIKVNDIDVSDSSTVDEVHGIVTLDSSPDEDDVVTVVGSSFKYFTDAEINGYVNTAFSMHGYFSTDIQGRPTNISSLPAVEEYPLIILASTLALHTLATDAAFDIDIIAPDGVSIPRSERFRQLSEQIQIRKEQYDELSQKLNIGMNKIEVFNLRKIAWRTNRYVPIYRPLEVGDLTLPERVYYPVPTYGGKILPSSTGTYDLQMYQGDSFSATVDFPFNVTGYTIKAQIRPQRNSPVLLANFTVTVVDAAAGTVTISLPRTATDNLPLRSYWDIQLTTDSDPDYRQTFVSGIVYTEREVTQQ